MIQSAFANFDVTVYVDFRIVFLLLGVGFLIKHLIPKCDNKYIPAILLLVSFAYTYTTLEAFDLATVTQGLVTAIIASSVAIGIHTNGKGILKIVSNSIKNATNEVTDTIDSFANEVEEISTEIDSISNEK